MNFEKLGKAQMSWRFLPFASGKAAYNMAVDESILNSHLAGDVPATVRLYEFSPPAVSLGYAQTISHMQFRKLGELGFDVVRRPTGGRAVLHRQDLTYSFVASVKDTISDGSHSSLSQSVVESHKQICQALIFAFARFGIQLELGRSQSNYRDYDDCFEATTTADLHFRGRKVVGSAQLRRKSALLQHGSILLKPDPAMLSHLLHREEARKLRKPEASPENTPENTKNAGSLFELIGRAIEPEEFNQAFKTGFGQAFGVSFYDGELSSLELKEITRLTPGYGIISGLLPSETSQH